jgi:outer membrane protein assembly factor BamB
MAVDAAGDVIVTGYTDTATLSDMLTIKFSGVTGAEIWQQRFDDAFSSFDQAWALALDSDGSAIVAGYAWTGNECDIKVIKYASADGAILWQTQFTGPGIGVDFGIAIGVDSAGNVIVGGNVWNGTDDDMVTIKFAASDGAVLWSRTFAGAAGAGARHAASGTNYLWFVNGSTISSGALAIVGHGLLPGFDGSSNTPNPK